MTPQSSVRESIRPARRAGAGRSPARKSEAAKRTQLNLRPAVYETAALPSELTEQARCRTDLSSSNRQWHGERMRPPPGSRVISCENAIRPPAITDGPRLLRHTCIHRLSKSRAVPLKTPIAPPGVVRAGGAISHPHGERSWTRTSRSRVVPSRLHAVVLPVPRLQPQLTWSIHRGASTANPGALARDFRRPMESERHALAPWLRGRTHSALLSHGYGFRHGRWTAGGKARWGKRSGVH